MLKVFVKLTTEINIEKLKKLASGLLNGTRMRETFALKVMQVLAWHFLSGIHLSLDSLALHCSLVFWVSIFSFFSAQP